MHGMLPRVSGITNAREHSAWVRRSVRGNGGCFNLRVVVFVCLTPMSPDVLRGWVPKTVSSPEWAESVAVSRPWEWPERGICEAWSTTLVERYQRIVYVQCVCVSMTCEHRSPDSDVRTCISSGLPVAFQCVQIMQINTGSTLGHHWELASASVVPVASQGTCGSSGPPVWSVQWYPSALTESGLEIIGSGHFPACNPLCIQLVWWVVWAQLISFELPPQIHKNYNGAYIKGIHQVMLKYSHVYMF